MKTLWMFFFIVIVAMNAVEAEAKGRVFTSYAFADTKHDLRILKELNPGDTLFTGDYDINAQLSLKHEERDITFESMGFEPSETNSSSSEQFPKGWTSSDKTYTWNPDNENLTLTIPLTTKSTGNKTSLADSDEIHLDYHDLTPENPSWPSIKMTASWNEEERKHGTVIVNGRPLMQLKSLDLYSSPWKEKNISYLAKRTFEMPHDSSWVFAKKRKYFFFQNRFHLNLNTVETIDIHFKPNTSLKKINSLSCNLRIGSESLIFPTKNMECGWFPKRIFRSNGHLVLRLWTGNIFRSEFNENKKYFFDEIIFMMSREIIKNIQEQPVAAIQIHTLRQPEITNRDATKNETEEIDIKDQTVHFQTAITTLTSKRKQLIFPLEVLKNKLGRNNKIENVTLSLQPAHWGTPSKFHLQSLKLINRGSEQYPIILNTGQKLSSRWGGPFFNKKEHSEKIEWIRVQDFFSFTSPIFNQESKPTTFLKETRQEKSKFKTTSRPINFKGINIQAQNELQSLHADKDGLLLEGKGNWVEIDWPLNTKLDKNTRFYMNFGAGKGNILDLEIKPSTDSQNLPSVFVSPNKSVRLNWQSQNVKRLKIKVLLLRSPFILQLKEVVVFQPTQLKPPNIFDIPTLIEGETPLVPKNVQTSPQKKVTIFKRHLSTSLWSKKASVPNKLSWITKVNRNFKQIQGLKISYKVPPTMHANNPCWLQFTLVSTNHKVSRTMCSESSTNEIIFSAENIFRGINSHNNEILKYISWEILAENRSNITNQPLPVDIATSLIGYDIQTFSSELLNHPVMEWNGTALYPASLKEISKEDEIQNTYFTSLGLVSIKDETQTTPLFNTLDHPLVQIKKIVLKKKDPISADEQASLAVQEAEKIIVPEEIKNPTYLHFIIFSLLVGSLWWVGRQNFAIFSLKDPVNLAPELAEKQIREWLAIGAGLYLLGLFYSLAVWKSAEDISLTLAGLAILMAWRSLVWKTRPDIELNFPELAIKIYNGAGGPYFFGFIISLGITVFLFIIGLKLLAEHILVIGYDMLVVGMFFEFRALRNYNHQQKKRTEPTNTETEATLA
jgi:hypothetical protein